MFGIVGGTGLGQLENFKITRRQIVRTPFGEASQPLVFGEMGGVEVVFLARHGSGHTIPPHAINYRANVWALHAVGVRQLLAIATVGGIADNIRPCDVVLPHQIIDYTHGRQNTYHDGVELPVNHIDFTYPYDSQLRELCKLAAANTQQSLLDGGVYACVQGPRLETAAEINRLDRDGATIVGMTGMPEAALARELGVRYAALCPVANYAAGRGESANGIEYEKMTAQLVCTIQKIRLLIEEVVRLHQENGH